MIDPQKIKIWIGVVFFAFFLAGCPSQNQWRWWEESSNVKIKGYVTTSVGAASVVKNSFGRTDTQGARSEARAKAGQAIAYYLGVKIKSIALDWSKEMGDAVDKKSFLSFSGSGTIQVTFVNANVRGAQVLGYYYDKKNHTMYCLMGLRSPDFLKKFKETLASNLEQLIPAKKKKNNPNLNQLKANALKRLDELVEKTEKKVNSQGRTLESSP